MKHFRIEATWSSGNSMVSSAEARNDSHARKIAKEKVAGMPDSYGKLVELIVYEVPARCESEERDSLARYF